MKTIYILILFACFSITNLYAQNLPQGDQTEIKQTILQSNEITSLLFNYGSFSKPNTLSNIADFVWKKLGYMFEFGPIAAAKIITDNGDTLHITDDSFILPTQGSYDPANKTKWGWLPQSGYANPNQNELATKNNPASWPSLWKLWPYENNDSSIISLNEAYYVMDDFSNAKFPYYPFPNDSNKRGLGLKVEVRVYQFGGALKDAIIIKYKITNVSPKNLDEVYFGFQGDPHIGGASDYSDDRIQFIGPNGPAGNPKLFNSRNTIYLWDQDLKGVGGITPGYMSFKFLNTPGNKDITSLHIAPYTNSLPNVPKNSELMWQWLSGGIDYENPYLSTPMDYIVNFGTGPFTLLSGESKDLTLVIFMSDDYQDMLKDATNIFFDHNWPNIGTQIGQSGGSTNYKIAITSPGAGEFNGSIPIQWNYTGTDPEADLLLEYSSDRGKNWLPVAWDIPVDSSYTWNTEEYKDGVNYLLRIIAYNRSNKKQYYYNIVDQKFTINNLPNAQPELELNLPNIDSVYTDAEIIIPWTAEDADNTDLNINIEYANNSSGPYSSILNKSFNTGNNSYAWNISNMPNGKGYYLKVTASDGLSDTSLTYGPFEINYSNKSYTSYNFIQLSGNSTPEFYIQEIDTSSITDHTYEITFDVNNSSSKLMTIKDINLAKEVISNYPLKEGMSTPAFDGIKLTVNDYKTSLNLNESKFSRSELNSEVELSFPPVAGNPKIAVPNDWIIIFNNMDTTAAGEYLYPGDTVKTNISGVNIITPFKIYNTTENEPANYLVFVNYGTLNLSKWENKHIVILQPQSPNAPATTTYQIKFNFTSSNFPRANDTLFIKTYKTITSNDVFRIAVDNNKIVTSIKDITVPGEYILRQNYPNPFNPSTFIDYQLSVAGLVSLKVYNILGQEVLTLVNKYQVSGKHSVIFNAGTLASGMYIYQLRVNDFISSRKMLFLK